jgi:ribonuclease P protein component
MRLFQERRMDQRADKRFRITRRKDFSRLFEEARRATDDVLTLYALRNDLPQPRSRAGVAVGKRHGRAAKRNRLKRLCREAFRLTRPSLPEGWDFMIVPRVGSELSVERLSQSISVLGERLTQDSQGDRKQ